MELDELCVMGRMVKDFPTQSEAVRFLRELDRRRIKDKWAERRNKTWYVVWSEEEKNESSE